MTMNHRELTFTAIEKIKLVKGPVLDVGCRDNSLKKIFENKGFKWTGCDLVSDKDVDQCKMEELPYKTKRFELVFVCHSFEHTERPVEALREFQRVLSETGKLIISTPIHCKHQILDADEDHINVITKMQMERLLRYVGLKKEKIWIVRNNPDEDKNNSMITVCMRNDK